MERDVAPVLKMQMLHGGFGCRKQTKIGPGATSQSERAPQVQAFFKASTFTVVGDGQQALF
jgi:hypothetical protein